jgi:hypothetical protein
VAQIVQPHTVESYGISSRAERSPERIGVDRPSVPPVEYEVPAVPRGTCEQPAVVLLDLLAPVDADYRTPLALVAGSTAAPVAPGPWGVGDSEGMTWRR